MCCQPSTRRGELSNGNEPQERLVDMGDQSIDKNKFSSKGLNKTLAEYGTGPLEKYRRVLDEKTNVQSTNRGFRTIQHSVCTYEQTKTGLSYFYLKTIVLDDGLHTKPLLF